ncbi:exosortase/archaeosortase family protein [Chloroflexota bacterium]
MLKTRILSFSVFIGIIVLYLPVLIWLVQEWLNNPFYGHGFIVPIVSAISFWMKRDNFKLEKPSLPGIIICFAGLLIYVLSFSIWGIYFLSALSLLIVIFGAIVYLVGMGRAREFLFPIGFLFFMIPMPIVNQLSYYMQNFTSYATVAVVRLFNVDITAVGNQISLSNSSFIIGPQCSGMNSIISLLTIAVFLAFMLMTCNAFWKKIILSLSALPLAVLSNIVRITILLIIAENWGTEAAMSYFHNISSPLLFILSITLLFVLAKFLRFRFKTIMELSYG